MNVCQVIDEAKKEFHPFIVFEGLDGSGKTTQAKMLHDKLLNEGIESIYTKEPTDSIFGKFVQSEEMKELIQQYTSLGIDKYDKNRNSKYINQAISSLFTADRIDHLYNPVTGLHPESSKHPIICDRYLMSTLAYQCTDLLPETGSEYITESAKTILKHQLKRRLDTYSADIYIPDIIFYIDIDVETAYHRIDTRGNKKSVFEQMEFLKKVKVLYNNLIGLFMNTFNPDTIHPCDVIIINGSLSINTIHEMIWMYILLKMKNPKDHKDYQSLSYHLL